MDLISQLQPHTPAKFVRVDMRTAMAVRHDRAAMLDNVRTALR
jgi:allophanate hydrolase subunit 2